jgi:drug/metabolite transporter (DMT)-like permease
MGKIRMVCLALFVTFLWGSVAPVIKLGYQSFGIQANQIGQQFLFASHITLLASLLLFLITKANKQTCVISPSSLYAIIPTSFFQVFLNYVFFFIGVGFRSGTIGSIMAGTTSLFQLIFAHFVYKNEKLTAPKAAGLGIGVLGMMFLYFTDSFSFSIGLGDFCLLASVLTGAWGNILAAKRNTDIDTKVMTAYAMLMSGIAFFVLGYGITGTYPFAFGFYQCCLLFYLGAMTAMAMVIWNHLMREYSVGSVSLFLFFIPVFGVLISAALLQENIQNNTLCALVLVIVAIVVVNKRPTKVKNHFDEK